MSAWVRLLVSHVVVISLGVAAGFAYTTKVSTSTETVLQGFKRRPLLDVAKVALQFGSPEHARATLRDACRQLRGSDCPPDELRALAAKLAQERH